jgi:hypothetical protein
MIAGRGRGRRPTCRVEDLGCLTLPKTSPGGLA